MDLISREKAIRVTIGMTSETGIDEAPIEYAESNLKRLPSAFEGMTNGEVIQALFPNETLFEQTETCTYYGNMRFDTEWWNAPYQKGDK